LCSIFDEPTGSDYPFTLAMAEENLTVSLDASPHREPVLSLLRHCFGPGVHLQCLSLVKDGIRCVVMRAAIQGGPAGVASVILKQVKPEKEPRGMIDWASLAFLTGTRAARGIAPRLYDGAVEHGLFAMEDLGDAPTLDALLRGADPSAARQALRTLAAEYGRMHAETKGREERFRRCLETLPITDRPDFGLEVAQSQARVKHAVEEWSWATRRRPPRDFKRVRRLLYGAIAASSDWRAFTHGDPAPTNCLVAGDTVHLLDFEYGGFRHALYDLTAWYVLFPLPEELVEEMSECYRNELVQMVAPARDERWYRSVWAMLCAYRALALLSWIPRSVLTDDEPWVEEWTARQAVLCTLDRLARVTAPHPGLQTLGEWGHQVGAELRARWPDTTDLLPAWPALQSYRGHHES
jgi:aminoglycoside/choline kinase family phosphotransferase